MLLTCLRAVAFAALACLSLTARADDAESCEAKYAALAPAAIRMPYREFDQSPEGWRQLGNCFPQAARLLDRYAKKQEYESRALRWHLAQTLAMAGDKVGAIESALLSLNPPDIESRSNFSWNTYALATVAFLRGDRAAFGVQHEAHRKAAQLHKENQTNLEVLDRLARCFEQPYLQAYTCSVGP